MQLVRRSAKHLILAAIAATALSFVNPASAGLPWALGGNKLPSLAPMLQETMPSVVHIATVGHSGGGAPVTLGDPFLDKFFGIPEHRKKKAERGLGSGVILDASKGLIVTNAHVVEGADDIKVTLRDGRRLGATLVGKDEDADVAVIHIDADNLTQVKLSDSEALRVGDFVVAIGNPFGLKQTVTSGIVSGLGRSGLGIESYEDFIQTDASINPGNSGGALVNLNGELVGMNTAILGPNGGNIGIGFAIPVNMVKSIVDQLVEYGEVRRGRLGVGIQNLTPDLAQAFDLPNMTGVVIAQVEKGSAADQAGLLPGDVVTRVNGKDVQDAAELRNSVGLLRVGSKVSIDVHRDGAVKTVVAKISEPKAAKLSGRRLGSKLNGAMLSDRGGEDGRGVKVLSVEPGSASAKSGLMPEDVILSVNRAKVDTVAEMEKIILASRSKAMLLNVVRGDSALFLLIQ
ncbi:MAG: Do family serine endopeptidase [bacterium]